MALAALAGQLIGGGYVSSYTIAKGLVLGAQNTAIGLGSTALAARNFERARWWMRSAAG